MIDKIINDRIQLSFVYLIKKNFGGIISFVFSWFWGCNNLSFEDKITFWIDT